MEKIQQGPFRATRLWNMVATSFRQIPVGIHWKNMRKYDDCFTSTEAVDWMIEYLKQNPNFGEEKGTRAICIKMLDRLLQHEAFEPVRAAGSQPAKFKEDGQLYRFTSRSFDKAVRPLSSWNCQQSRPSIAETAKITAEDVWLDELKVHLAKLLRLDSPADLECAAPSGMMAIDVSNVTSNVVNPNPRNEDAATLPDFVQSAVRALENCFLRGLSQPLIGCATNDLLRRIFELLSPQLERRHSWNLDSSSSVESFMQEILTGGRRGSYPDVCLETAFTGTVPETRVIRKRPRSNSLFPTTDFMIVQNSSSSRSGSAECIATKSSSDSGSIGNEPLMPSASLQTPVPLVDSGSGSLERMNPGYRDDTFGDDLLEDQFFTPMGKLPPEIDWKELQIPASRELIGSVQLALLAETPNHRAQLERLLKMFEKIFKNNQLHFSEELTTQDFVTHCFTPLVFGESDPTLLDMMTFMVWHRAAIFSPVDDFKLKVELRMKSLGMVPSFCKRITKNEYEDQRNLQNGHMKELLNGIVTNTTMNIKEKRKKLKQFQKSYPDIYAARFNNSTSEESIFAACAVEKPKARLTKFKSLRM